MATIQRADLQQRLRKTFGMTGTTLLDMDRTLVPVVVVEDITQKAVDVRQVSFHAQSPAVGGAVSQIQLRNLPGSGLECIIDRIHFGQDQSLVWAEVTQSSADFGTIVTTQGYVDGLSFPVRPTPLVLSTGSQVGTPTGPWCARDNGGFVGVIHHWPSQGMRIPPGWGLFLYGGQVLAILSASFNGRLRAFEQ